MFKVYYVLREAVKKTCYKLLHTNSAQDQSLQHRPYLFDDKEELLKRAFILVNVPFPEKNEQVGLKKKITRGMERLQI